MDVTQKANRCGTRRWKQWEDWSERREVTNKERIKLPWMTDEFEKNKCFRKEKA